MPELGFQEDSFEELSQYCDVEIFLVDGQSYRYTAFSSAQDVKKSFAHMLAGRLETLPGAIDPDSNVLVNLANITAVMIIPPDGTEEIADDISFAEIGSEVLGNVGDFIRNAARTRTGQEHDNISEEDASE